MTQGTAPARETGGRPRDGAGRRRTGGRRSRGRRSAKPRPKSTGTFLRDLVVIVLIAILASFLIKTFLVRSFYIPSASMENTLEGDDAGHDRILVNELVPALFPVQRGDVVVFQDPGGWLAPDPQPAPQSPPVAAAEWLLSLVGLSSADSNDHLVKRVIGMPGDHVVCCTAAHGITVNGHALTEPYVRLDPGETMPQAMPFDVVVPAGDLWVMGDNRDHSSDSRYNQDKSSRGFVPLTDLVGRAFVVSWPATHWKVLGNYPGTFGAVPAAGR